MKVWILYLSSIVSSFSPKKEYAIKNHDKRGGFNLKCFVPLS